MLLRSFACVLVVSLAACGGSPSSGTDSGGGGGGDDGGGGSDAGLGSGWTDLVGRDWSMPSAQEGYLCTRAQVPTDMWVDGYHAVLPPGTHHEVLTISTTSTPLGDYACDSSTAVDTEMLYAAGLNTDDLMFPPGVAIHLTAGQYINLNLHLFNTTDDALTGHSGITVHTVDAASVVNPADMEFSGTFNINIPSDNMPHTVTGGCKAPADVHVFTLWPHMHQTATHQSFSFITGGVTTTLLDTDYSFSEQKNYPIADTLIPKGAQISTSCTYVNDTGSTKTFGESSTAEMCFTGMYKYPAGGVEIGCVTGTP